MRVCAVIPVYNHKDAIGQVVTALSAFELTCFLVDDGSDADCAQVLDALAAASTPAAPMLLLRHAQNQGKGAAVMTGIQAASDAGFSHVLQLDADGQHNVADVAKFVAAATQQPQAFVIGCPIYDESVPAKRFYARYLTHVWVWINTLSLQIKDTMCGFRVYPIDAVLALQDEKALGSRMDFDTEVLVRLCWAGLPVVNVPTKVSYPLDGVSHFRLWLDNALISKMHARLFFGMLYRSPRLLARKFGMGTAA